MSNFKPKFTFQFLVIHNLIRDRNTKMENDIEEKDEAGRKR